MRHLKQFGFVAASALLLMVLLGPSSASATELYQSTGEPSDTLAAGTEIAASLASGSSLLIKDEFGITENTCTGSEIKGKTEAATGTSVSFPASTLTFSCSDKMTIDSAGNMAIKWTSGTNGELISSGAEITIQSTFFGATALCKTGTGTKLGTVTGTAFGSKHATIDINAAINCPLFERAILSGTYTVTTPTGLGVEQS
jgi:hypothetical protein